MRVSDTNNNRGAHGDSSFMLGGLPSSSENPPALAVGSVKLDKHGWADVGELIEKMSRTQEFTMKDLEKIVETDKKQRYSFNEDKTKIRANQGHSIPVDVELKEAEPPKTLYHGTSEKYVSSIDRRGLIPKGRLYVHLSTDMRTAVEAGRRHGNPAMYLVDSEKMFRDGYKFFLSENGVWLTKSVPVKYLIKCTFVPRPRESEADKICKNKH